MWNIWKLQWKYPYLTFWFAGSVLHVHKCLGPYVSHGLCRLEVVLFDMAPDGIVGDLIKRNISLAGWARCFGHFRIWTYPWKFISWGNMILGELHSAKYSYGAMHKRTSCFFAWFGQIDCGWILPNIYEVHGLVPYLKLTLMTVLQLYYISTVYLWDTKELISRLNEITNMVWYSVAKSHAWISK